jgi:hypothetical protein
LSFRRAAVRRGLILAGCSFFGLWLFAQGLIRSDRRRYEFQREAFHHQYWLSMTTNPADPRNGRLTAYHRKMLAKYEWASRYPLLPVWPDPPEPE